MAMVCPYKQILSAELCEKLLDYTGKKKLFVPNYRMNICLLLKFDIENLTLYGSIRWWGGIWEVIQLR